MDTHNNFLMILVKEAFIEGYELGYMDDDWYNEPSDEQTERVWNESDIKKKLEQDLSINEEGEVT